MKRVNSKLVLALIVTLSALAVSAAAQIHRYYSPGTVWTVTTIRIKPGMDQAYFQYLDGEFKRESDAQVSGGFMKSYKGLRTMDDSDSWNLLILREYKSMASMEADEERSDALSQRVTGNDQTQMHGYEDRSKIREVLGTKTARELVLR